MKRLLSFIFAAFFFLSFQPQQARATHAAGAEILYEWVSDSTYRIFYKFYRDCVGAPEPTSVPICYYNSCNSVFGSVMLNKLAVIPGNTPNGSEIGSGCAAHPTTCTLASSSLPGYKEWWYYGTITLPSRCDRWTFFYGISGRNNAIMNLQNPGSQNLYSEATLDNLNAQGNTSPFFSVKPIPYICNGIPYTWNNGAYDRNNDSLAFDMIQPLTGGNNGCSNPNATSIPYSNPPIGEPVYNLLTNPFATNNTFNLNHITGIMTFTPSMVQRAAVTVRVSEYRYVPGFTKRKLIGTVMRDMQFTVLSCNDVPPVVTVNPATISGATYDGTTVQSCAGIPLNFCFKVTSQQPDAALQVTDNSTLMPEMAMTYANTYTDSVLGCVSWTPSLSDTGLKSLIITVKDTFCNVTGIQVVNTFTIPIYIKPSVTILSDIGICNGDSAQLTGYGTSGFVWDVLPGGAPLSSLSCTTCANPIAKPTVTTRYTLYAQLNNACSNRDTATVVVGMPIVDVKRDTTICVNNTMKLSLHFTGAPPNTQYAIKWTPATYLSSDVVSDPIINAKQDIQYIVTVAPNGNTSCMAVDTVNVRVLQGYTIYNDSSVTCNGAPVQVVANGDSRYTYTWSPTGGISKPNIVAPKIVTDTPVTYTLTASYTGCRDSITSFTIDTSCAPPANGISSIAANHLLLLQNYPNPFTDKTVVPFVVEMPSQVKVEVFDMVGKNIATVLKPITVTGQQQITIDAKEIGLSAGNYIYRIEVSNEKGLFRQARMMTVR